MHEIREILGHQQVKLASELGYQRVKPLALPCDVNG